MARLAVAAAILISYIVAALVLPQLLELADPTGWQIGLCGGGLALAAGVFVWSLRAAPPQADGSARAFPIQVAVVYFLAAIVAALITMRAFRGSLGIDLLLPGLLCYLLLLVGTSAVYLTARRLTATVRSGARPAIKLSGRRQSLYLGLGIAMQVPIILCGIAMVLVEQTNGARYERAIANYHRSQYAQLLERAQRVLDDDRRTQGMLEVLVPPPGIELFEDADGKVTWLIVPADQFHERPVALRVVPLVLMGFIIGLTMLLGRWIARRMTGDLRAVQRAINALHGGVQPETAGKVLRRAVALREMIGLADAVRVAVAGFAARRTALSRAASRRQASEQAKARFLRHLSHELKSPLNSILGFSELLLAEIEGPLTERQRQQLAAVWLSGERLERYILALLDLARLEESERAATQLSPKPTSAGQLVAAVREQLRPDPLGQRSIEVLATGEAPCRIDRDHTARAIRLAAGVVDDCAARGAVRISVGPAPGGGVSVSIELQSAEDIIPERIERVRILAEGREAEEATEAGASVRLLRSLSQAQGARFTVAFDDRGWPRCQVTLPAG